MVFNFQPVKAHSLELALQSWFDWIDSIRLAREQLGWAIGLSGEEWDKWSNAIEEDSVWDAAIKAMDRLNLPRLFAGYWIACLVSRYDPEDIHTFSSIEYPDWVLERLDSLQGTLLQQKPPYDDASSSIIIGQGLPDRFSKRALPPSYIGFSVPESASYITFHIPIFLLPGLARNTSALQDFIKQIVDEYGSHPVSALLQHIGRSAGWEWERSKVKQASDDQLRPLYDYLMQSEYLHEVLKKSTEGDIKKAVKSLKSVTTDEWLVAYLVEPKIGQSKRKQTKDKVRKRVSGWFKEAGRWPIPRE